MDRPSIPRQLERDVLVEAGHRCAIPTCRQIPVEICHIIPYSQVLKHEFDNLIALCPNCHTRYDRKQIDLTSMRQYKTNLSVINSRYSDFEQRILRFFLENPEYKEIRLSLSGNNDIQIMNLVKDGHLEYIRELTQGFSVGIDPDKIYRLTPKGREFIQHWSNAANLE